MTDSVQTKAEKARRFIAGNGFLGMLVVVCEECGDFIHVKPILGALHFCSKAAK
jgi:hypothetical protein